MLPLVDSLGLGRVGAGPVRRVGHHEHDVVVVDGSDDGDHHLVAPDLEALVIAVAQDPVQVPGTLCRPLHDHDSSH